MIRGKEYTLVNVYETHNSQNPVIGQLGTPQQNRAQILHENLQHLWKAVLENPSFKVLIGGDFNTVADLDYDVVDKKFCAWQTKQADVFSKFIEETNLSDVWKILYPDVKHFTHGPGQGTPARIDRFLVHRSIAELYPGY